MSSDAVSFARDLLDADPLAAVRGIAAGLPPDLVGLLALAEDALALAEACAEPDDARCYRVAADVLAVLPHGSATAPAPLPVGVQTMRAA